MKTRKGFTLVELAIALVVIGLISGIGVTAIVTTLAETRRAANVEKNLEDTKVAVINLIKNDESKRIPDEEIVDNLTAFEIRENFKFKWDKAITGNICQINTTLCRVSVCNNVECTGSGLEKTISNVLFSMVETGSNKTYDSQSPSGNATDCNVKIDRNNKNNDDKVVFYTLAEAKTLAGCNDYMPQIEIANETFPPLYKSKPPRDKEESIKLKITTINGVSNYKFCPSNPLEDAVMGQHERFNWVRTHNESIPNLTGCINFGYNNIDYSSSLNRPFLTLTAGVSGTKFNMPPGNYLFNMKAGYGEFPNGAIVTEKNIVLTLIDE